MPKTAIFISLLGISAIVAQWPIWIPTVLLAVGFSVALMG